MTEIDKETNELAYKTLGCAYKVHTELGPGLLENAYELCLCYELDKEGIPYERQKELPVIYHGQTINCGYRIDILVGNSIVVELKAVDILMPVHTAQLMTYLKLSNNRLGYLINFNCSSLKSGIKRIVHQIK
ncbi:GxxExxY protein [Bacteroides sp. 214]|uniref:GxxExxY protein n=1 Tax=Bacteroides sp. 214 TaxID=2302935 RepID=UPI0013D0F0FF|nr:GxxExxY protein [Bacteroides sp. 214]NDW12194.1 GxxExxY protein [Bacteroides sp. 214]